MEGSRHTPCAVRHTFFRFSGRHTECACYFVRPVNGYPGLLLGGFDNPFRSQTMDSLNRNGAPSMQAKGKQNPGIMCGAMDTGRHPCGLDPDSRNAGRRRRAGKNACCRD